MDRRRHAPVRRFAIRMVLIFFAVGSCKSDALAADWYPRECVGTSRCAEADGITYAHTPNRYDSRMLTVTTKHGTALVPPYVQARTSRDKAIHACMRPEEEGMELTCLFIPLGGAAPDRSE